MKAVVIHRFGGPEVLEIIELDVPEPGADQVRIRVEAAPVNPVDIGTRAGWLAEHGLMSANGQIGIGWDLAGVIDAVGPGPNHYKAGDPVIGMRSLLSAPIGAQAEYVVLGTDAIAPAPRSVSPIEASTIPLNGLAATQALDLLDLRAGQWLLVTGAAGALGGFALQLAALRGLQTIGVASPADEARVRASGANEFVARTEDVGNAVRRVVGRGVDGVLDAAVVGVAAHEALSNDGAFVAVSAGAAPIPLRGTRVHNVWIRDDAARLAGLAALVDAGRLALHVASTQPLDDVANAHERVAAGGARGRIVLRPSA